ncbi:unnamed protein product, partial [Laminaria digitata]
GAGRGGFFAQGPPSARRGNRAFSPRATPDITPGDTPLDSPRSGSGSDAAYDSLRGVLGKVDLGKYFAEFRRREIRLEELKHLTEPDLIEMGLPMGARKRLLAEIHGFVSPTAGSGHGSPPPVVVLHAAALERPEILSSPLARPGADRNLRSPRITAAAATASGYGGARAAKGLQRPEGVRSPLSRPGSARSLGSPRGLTRPASGSSRSNLSSPRTTAAGAAAMSG